MKLKKSLVSIILSCFIAFSSMGVSDALTYRATSPLNIRTQCSPYSTRVGYIPRGNLVNVSYINRYGWARVNYGGVTGWASSVYLTKATNSVVKNNNYYSYKKPTYNYSYSYNKTPRLIVVNKTYKTVKFYKYGKVAYSSYCAVGKPSTPTPNGRRMVREKVVNRPYYKKGIAGGSPYNPLGVRWIGLGNGYGIHGTNQPYSIGGAVSGGCVRLTNNNVMTLYNMVRYGDIVVIGTGSDKSIANRYGYRI